MAIQYLLQKVFKISSRNSLILNTQKQILPQTSCTLDRSFSCNNETRHGLHQSTHTQFTRAPSAPTTMPSIQITRQFSQVNRILFASDKSDTDASTKTVDEFRKNEENIEKEYERREKQNEKSNNAAASDVDPQHEKIEQVRRSILDASLQMVAQHGWSREAIIKGAELVDYPGVAHGMFPNGGYELIQHFYRKCNEDLVKYLLDELITSDKTSDKSNDQTQQHSPADFAKKAIRKRLEMLIPYLNTWPQALAVMTLPQNAPTSLAQLLTLVDDICYYAGDRSVDIGWYTRRVGLAAIYKMTEVHLLQDKSPNFEETWKFLDRRMEEAVHIQDVLSISDQATKNMTHALSSAFVTARNMLGMNPHRK